MDIFEVRKNVFQGLKLTTAVKVLKADGSIDTSRFISRMVAGTQVQIDLTLANQLTAANILEVGPVRFTDCQIHIAGTHAADLVGGSPQILDIGELWSGQVQKRSVRAVLKRALITSDKQPIASSDVLTAKAHARFVVEDLFVGSRDGKATVSAVWPIKVRFG